VRVLFTTGVWGDAYLDKFVRVSLPTQLAEGNLDGAGDFDGSKYLIVTSTAGKARLERAPIYRYLCTRIATEIVALRALDQAARYSNKYELMNLCQMQAISLSCEYDAVMFGYADTLWSRGTFQNAARRLAEGYDGVFAPGIPVREAEFLAALRRAPTLWKHHGEIETLELSPRALVAMTLEWMHPMAEANFWHQPALGSNPAYVMWDVPQQGVTLRAFHLHPVMIRAQPRNPTFFRKFSTSLDEEYVSNLFSGSDHLYFARDSDELALCSLMQPFSHGFATNPPQRPSVRNLALWAEAHASTLHRDFFDQEYRLHHTDVVDRDWSRVGREGALLARRVRERTSIPDSILAIEDPTVSAARRGRTERLRYWQRPDFMDPWWLGSVADTDLVRVIRRRVQRKTLRIVNRAARRMRLDLRGIARRALVSARSVPWIARVIGAPRQRLRDSDPDEAMQQAMSLCEGYPIRRLVRWYLRRKLAPTP
jgi:hypothetical protein